MKSSAGALTLTFAGAGGGAVSVQDTRQRAVGGPIISVYDVGAVPSTSLRLMAGSHTLVRERGLQARHHRSLTAVRGDGARSIDLDAARRRPGPSPASGPQNPASDRLGFGLRTTADRGRVGRAGDRRRRRHLRARQRQKSDLDKGVRKTCSYSSDADRQSFEDDKSSLKTAGHGHHSALDWRRCGWRLPGATLFVIGGSSSEKPAVAFAAGPNGTGFGLQAPGELLMRHKSTWLWLLAAACARPPACTFGADDFSSSDHGWREQQHGRELVRGGSSNVGGEPSGAGNDDAETATQVCQNVGGSIVSRARPLTSRERVADTRQAPQVTWQHHNGVGNSVHHQRGLTGHRRHAATLDVNHHRALLLPPARTSSRSVLLLRHPWSRRA